jgi:hypothetical protein
MRLGSFIPGKVVEPSSKNLADSPAALCPICGEPVDASQTAVAVIRGDGSPGLVHPACYPQFSAQQRNAGNLRFADSPLRDLGDPPAAGSPER